jgi:hypothetical protein
MVGKKKSDELGHSVTIYRRGLQALGRLIIYFRRSAFLEHKQFLDKILSAPYKTEMRISTLFDLFIDLEV